MFSFFKITTESLMPHLSLFYGSGQKFKKVYQINKMKLSSELHKIENSSRLLSKNIFLSFNKSVTFEFIVHLLK